MNCDTVQTIVGFLTAKEAAGVARTSKLFAKTVRNNVCIVVEEEVCWGEATPGMTWEGQEQTDGQSPAFRLHFVETKEKAKELANKLKLNKRTFLVRCGLQKDFTHIGWWNYGEETIPGNYGYDSWDKGPDVRMSLNWFYVC